MQLIEACLHQWIFFNFLYYSLDCKWNSRLNYDICFFHKRLMSLVESLDWNTKLFVAELLSWEQFYNRNRSNYSVCRMQNFIFSLWYHGKRDYIRKSPGISEVSLKTVCHVIYGIGRIIPFVSICIWIEHTHWH